MKVISFDVGIKNMAFCILSKNDDKIDINQWGVLNLMNEEPPNNFTCDCIIPAKTKKQTDKICGKKAKYSKNQKYFCEKHAKSNKQFMIPTKKTSRTFLKKQKVDTLTNICNSHLLFLTNNNKKLKKDEIIDKLDTFYNEKCLQVLETSKKKSASEIDLVEVGRNMKRCLNELSDMTDITHVVIENQISPIANRMKTIQGMLAQYFIMINENIDICFVSSANKLKQFNNIELKNEIIENKETTKTNSYKPKNNPNYKENKKDGIYFCNSILNSNEHLHNWKEHMLTKKKDDLADSFLQGLWYFKQRNIIYYAEDLKIKLV